MGRPGRTGCGPGGRPSSGRRNRRRERGRIRRNPLPAPRRLPMSTDPRFLPGDRVFVHGGPFRGETHTVLAVEDGPVPWARVRVRYDPDEPEEEATVSFDDLCLVAPPRRSPLDDILH